MTTKKLTNRITQFISFNESLMAYKGCSSETKKYYEGKIAAYNTTLKLIKTVK